MFVLYFCMSEVISSFRSLRAGLRVDVLVIGVGGVCDMCMCLVRGGVGGEGGLVDERIGFGLYQSCGGQGECLDMCLCFGCGGVGGVGGEWVGGLDQGRERWGGVMSVRGVCLDSLCRLQV